MNFHEPTITVGVDPGLTGAVALVDHNGYLLDAYDMPVIGKHINAHELASYEGWRTTPERFHVIIEQVASRPGQSSVATFTFGHGVGSIEATFAALGVPLTRVTPATWKKHYGLGKDKNDSRRKATELWPTRSALFARVKDDGRAEAALIARYGWETRAQPARRSIDECTPAEWDAASKKVREKTK
jgi:crossover junction endodeoxyribonuclease RuvC